MRTTKAIKKCFHWLAFCIEIGWDKKDIDALEELWWKHHNEETGEVIRTAIEKHK